MKNPAGIWDTLSQLYFNNIDPSGRNQGQGPMGQNMTQPDPGQPGPAVPTQAGQQNQLAATALQAVLKNYTG